MPNKSAFTKSRRIFASLCAVGLGWAPALAHGYTIKNAIAPGCHEQITSLALRTVRADLATAAPLPATPNEQALINDLQFTPEKDMADFGAATLMIAVRDNDLKGRGSADLTELALIHGDPAGQEEHCLRNETQKEPGGTEAAITACRAFIRGRVLDALEGLDAAGKPDLTKRTSLLVHLSIRGGMDASLPTYYVRIGQAIHAIEDSFSHTYRTADGMRITVALNWIDYVNKTLVEARDGPAHSAQLDVCNDPDDLRKRKRELATDASAAVLRATLDPTKTKEEKMATIDATLDQYLSFMPGCTSENHWCDAPEAQLTGATGCGCTAGPFERGLGAVGAFLALMVVTWRARRRRSTAILAGALAIAFALPLSAGSAQAQTESDNALPAAPATTPKAEAAAEHAPPPPTVTPVKEPLPPDPSQMAWGGSARLSASVDKAALAVSVGVRLRVSKHWSFGLDGEWNPWIAVNGTPIRRGVVNVYATAILRFPLAYENFNLRGSLSLGTSYLLTDFYGAPSGSVGLYVGVSPLAVEWKASRFFYLIISPINIAVPIPQLTGVPFLYPQYRFTVGLEFYEG